MRNPDIGYIPEQTFQYYWDTHPGADMEDSTKYLLFYEWKDDPSDRNRVTEYRCIETLGKTAHTLIFREFLGRYILLKRV